MMEDLKWWVEDHLGCVIGGAVVILLAGILYLDARQEDAWAKWAVEHNCNITGSVSSSMGIGSNGKSVYIPGKTIYTCEGKTIIR